jgi:hypothetical protein
VTIVGGQSLASARTAFHLGAPRLDIGGLSDDPDLELDSRNGLITALRLTSGGVVIADGALLRYYDAKGRLLRRVGRPGGGPGEFRSIESICLIQADTLVAFDGRQRRMSLFDSRGEFVRTVPLPGSVKHHPCLADGSIIVTMGRTGQMGSANPTARYARISSSGMLETQLPEWPEDLYGLIFKFVAVVAEGEMILVGDPTSGQVELYREDGTLLRIVRWTDTPRPITPPEIEEELRRGYPTGYHTAAEKAVRARLLAAPRPPSWPEFTQAFLEETGGFWLALPKRRGVPQELIGFDANGKMLGRLPVRLQQDHRSMDVVRIAHGEAVLRYLDDDGAVHMAFVPILAGPPPGNPN